MSGWAWAGIFTAVWIACSPLVGLALGRLIRHGENQADADRKAREQRRVPTWARPTRARLRRLRIRIRPGRHRR